MTSQAETVELLVRKANFQPHVALAVVEAIDNSIKESQFVTVPMLDARFAELKAMIEVSNERLLKELTTTRGQFSADLRYARTIFGRARHHARTIFRRPRRYARTIFGRARHHARTIFA
jgi:hypothetical protein